MIRYFISDLHLSDKRPDLIRAFVQLTQALVARNQEAEFYILGDFYEAWIGDDFHAEWNTKIENALAQLSQSGMKLFFMHGNRDFLIGDHWLARVGATFLQEQTVLSLDEGFVLLTHGDEYCLEDTEYQAFRQTVRSKQWQAHVLSLPLEQRIALASQLRNDSKSMATEKSMDIMDVTTSALETSLEHHQCQVLVHGHTHRPSTHRSKNYLRCVLGDWDDAIWLANIDQGVYSQSKASIDEFNQTGMVSFKPVHSEVLF